VTVSYDGAGRADTSAITTASGLGSAVAKTKTVYDPQTGQAVRTRSLDASNNVTAEIVRTYDGLGRLVSYADADSNTSTTTYDIASRVATC
jgi:YD repeat-containing protein